MENCGTDKNFYFNDVEMFRIGLFGIPVEETGICFSSEIDVYDNVSVITDKKVKMNSPEESINTYLKVLEIRDLSEDEIRNISKFRLFFKKLFEVFFRNQKFRVFLTSYWLLFLGFEIATDDYLTALIYIAGIALYTSPIKFAKEMKKMFSSGKRKNELKDELTNLNIMGLVNSIPDDDGIQLYFKPKGN